MYDRGIKPTHTYIHAIGIKPGAKEYIMIFVANFKSEVRYAIYLDMKHVGLAFLRKAREESNTPDLLPEKVCDFALAFHFDPMIEITEKEAERAGRYEDAAHIEVTVPAGALNQFVELRTDIDRNSKTGEIIIVKPVWVLDKDRLKVAWLAAGAPFEWNPEEN